MRALMLIAMLIWPRLVWADVVLVQSTTSTENSGLFDHILPEFEAETGIDVRVVAVGTGQAIRNASRGDGDVLLVHSREAEDAFVAAGFGLARSDVMYNDFVIVGPADDPASLGTADEVQEAMHLIYAAQAPFVSRGDESGTHRAELRLWNMAGLQPEAQRDAWYLETGSGMGAALNTAAGLKAYTLTDRATWMAFGNKRGLGIVFEGDGALFNQYGVIAVNPATHPHVNARGAQLFVDWLVSERGQAAIGAFTIEGEQMFFPNAALDHRNQESQPSK